MSAIPSRQLAFERRDMVYNRLALLAAVSLLCETPGAAREVVVTHFSDAAVKEEEVSPTAAPVTAVLRHHLERMVEPTSKTIPKIWPKPTAFDWVSSSNTLPAMTTEPCILTHYAPTWWLPPEVEVRRAAHFGTISSIACEFGIPTSLLDAVISQESGYKGWAMSPVGAMGLMQIMPGTARTLGLKNPWDSVANLRAGARYLRQQLDRFGRVDLALAAYNAGPERRSLAHGNLPAIAETRNYVRTIITNWLRLTRLNRPYSSALARAAAASFAVRASGYREVSLVAYDGMNSANPI